MSLLREIQDAATGEEVSLAVVLRKCLVLASRLGHEPLKEWAKAELNGYAGATSLPDYRHFRTEARGTLVGPFGSQRTNQPIPPLCVKEEHREMLFGVEIRDGIAGIESLVNPDEAQLQVPWPADVIAYYQEKIIEAMVLVSAHKLVGRSTLVDILDTVRNRVLEFSLEIERENPQAGEAVPGADVPPVPETTVSQIFNTTILGGQNIVQAGDNNIMENVQQVSQGDWDGLARVLSEIGVEEDELVELKSALAADAEDDGESPGPQTQSWISRATTKGMRGGMRVSGHVAAQVIAQGVAAFLGIG